MIKTFKVQLLPNNKQYTKLLAYAGAARFAYNWALAKEMDSLKNKNGFIPDGKLRKEFTKMKKLPEFRWLNNISNNVTKQAIKDLCGSYNSFFKKKKQTGYKPYSKKFLAHMKRIGKEPTYYQSNGHPKFKKKRNVEDYGFYQDNVKICFTDTHVKVEGFASSKKKNKRKLNWIRLAEHGRIPTDTKYLNPRVTFDGTNWWISVGIEVEDSKIMPNNNGIGIDLGIKDLAVCSDGNVYKNINKTRKSKQLQKRKRRLQRKVSRKYLKNKKGESYQKTSNIIRSENKLLKLNKRLTNIRRNYIHQTTTEIINRKPIFITVEDLNVSGMMKNKYLSEAIQRQCFYEFKRQLEYKTKWNNIELRVVDRFYPSSKMCHNCGSIKKNLKLSDRIYKCECGYVEDRDFNASLNLRDATEYKIA